MATGPICTKFKPDGTVESSDCSLWQDFYKDTEGAVTGSQDPLDLLQKGPLPVDFILRDADGSAERGLLQKYKMPLALQVGIDHFRSIIARYSGTDGNKNNFSTTDFDKAWLASEIEGQGDPMEFVAFMAGVNWLHDEKKFVRVMEHSASKVEEKPKTPWYRDWRIWAAVAFTVIGGVASAVRSRRNTPRNIEAETPPQPAPEPPSPPEPSPQALGPGANTVAFAKGATQVLPQEGRLGIGRAADLIHLITRQNGGEILRRILETKYVDRYWKWNIVVLGDGEDVEIRVADSMHPEANKRIDRGGGKIRWWIEQGIKHDQIAEAKPAIFAGTIHVEGNPPNYKLILTNDSGAYGRQIRIYPEKITELTGLLARRFGIEPNKIEFVEHR